MSDSMFSAAFDVLIKILESYRRHIPTPGRPWSSLCRSSCSRTRRASAPVTSEAGEVVLSLLRPMIG